MNTYTDILLCIVSIILSCLIYVLRTYKYNMNDTTLQIVVAKYKENTQWTKYTNHNTIIYSKIEGEPNYVKYGKDSETTSYLRFIIDNYNNLSDWTLFTHGHEYHWHHPLSILKSCDINLDKLNNECKFFSINHGKWGITKMYTTDILKEEKLPIMIQKNDNGFTPSELTTK